MSSKIDERIVGMKFNGDQFQKGVADTNRSLEKLKAGLNLNGASKGLNDLNTAGKNFSLANLANGVQDIASRFGAMSIIGITALANIASKAVDVGLQMARSLTVDPIKAGLAEYELKMGSIQTILSNTARYGTSLQEVTGSLDELNTYADKTIYNFGDMTKNIGLFTNAGLRVEEATSMIKGFSNEAAASGTNAQGAASAAYQLSQALSAGTIRLMDWRSLQNVGMGNKNMQNGLIEVASAMGMLNDETTTAEEIQANFNGSLEKNWLSADVMSTYLKIMAGDLDAAGMSAMGLTDAQIKMFQTQQRNAEEAATKVRTFTQLIGTMQESVGSGWAQTFDILIGDFNTATDLWTAVNDELGDMIGKQADARNKLLEGFVKVGGRDDIIAGIAAIWQAVQMYIMPIKSAFHEIFPPTTVATLKVISTWFKNFGESLKPTGETMALLKRTFMGVFAVLDIGWMVLKEVIGLFGRLFGAATEGAGGILEVTANLGDWLVTVRDAIKDGDGLAKVFEWLGNALQKPIDLLRKFGKATLDFISVDNWAQAWENVGKALQKVGEFFEPIMKWIGEAFQNTKKVLTDFFKEMDFNVLVGLLNVGAIGGVGFLIKKGIDKIIGAFKGGPGGIIDTIKGVFGAVTDTFGELQNSLKAGQLQKIAIAIGIMTAAVIALSFVDTGKLFISLGAMATMFGMLAGMLMVMDTFMAKFNPAQMSGLAGSMVLMAGAMLILSAAVSIMGNLEWDELARGLVGLAGSLGALMGAMKIMSGLPAQVAKVAPALITMSIAMVLLATAVKIMSTLEWDEVGRGLTVFGGSLGAIVAAMQLMKKGAVGAGLLLSLAASLLIISGALKAFSTMSWDDIGRSLTVMMGAVGILVAAVSILSMMKMSPVGAATMIAMALAINMLIIPMKAFASMNWDEIGRSLVMLAGSLAILAGAMALMGIPLVALGGLALAVVSAGLMMLAPALVLLGTMEWDAIGRGLTMLGASLAILAVGGLLMIPASVGFLLLGAAIALIGAGAFMAGAGMVMFAAGFAALAGAAALGSEAIKITLQAISDMIPTMMASFAQGLIDFALVIANGGVQFTAAMMTLLQSLITAIGTVGPQVINTLWDLLMQMATKLEQNVPILVEKGGNLIIGVLNGMTAKIPGIARAGSNLMIALMRAISNEVPRLVDEGAKAIIRLVNGIAAAIDRNSAEMGRAGGRLASAIIRGMVNGIGAGVGEIVKAAQNMAKNALNAAKNFLGIRSPSREFFKVGSWSSEGVANGLTSGIPMVQKSAEKVGESALATMRKSLDGMKNAVATNMELNPTIKPVLDLSSVRQGSGLIGGLLTPPTLKVDDSYAYASTIAKSQREFEESRGGDDDDKPSGTTIIYNQTNNSPKNISEEEIYRQTHNQLSVVRKGQPTNVR